MKKTKLIPLLALSMFLCSSCGSTGVSQEEYDAIVAERDELQEQVAILESEIANSEKHLEENRTVSTMVSNETKETETKDNDVEKQENIDEKEENNIEILAEYTLSDGIGWYTRHFMVIRNNSSETVEVSTSSLAYQEDGTMVGAADTDFDALGSDCVSVIYEAFETDKDIAYYETDISSSPSKYYDSVIQDLSYIQNDIEDGAVFQVTNNGDEPAEFVQGYALFFLNDELVSYENTYMTDDDSEIKPGKTISKQFTSHKDFDRIEFYLTGRRN